MLEKYVIDKFGIIKQLEVVKINYDYNYSDKYNLYLEKCNLLSNLRLGTLLGAIGHVPKSILDIGYGNSSFLSQCKNIINECYGSDLHNKYPLTEGCEYCDNIYNKEVEVITFFDSLEHFDDIYIIDKLNCKYIMI